MSWSHLFIKVEMKCNTTNYNTTNYRPISILPIISKIMERWVHSVVYSLDECNLMITNTCYQAMERRKMTCTVCIDLSKAFDSVNHDIILDKLEQSNMSTSVIINWFKSYLYERNQSVTIGGGGISKSLPLNTRIYFRSTVIYYLHQ